jgi:hypothetical protein
MSFEVTVTPTVYNVEVEVNPSVQPFDVQVITGNVPDLDLTTNGDSGASTFDSLTGELNIPEYTLDGLGGVPESRTITINGVEQDLSADRTFTIPSATPVTIGSPANGLAIDVNQVLTIGLASSSTNGALSSTDWSTFNGKQNALTNPVTGTGATGQVSFWTGTGTQSGDSGLFWDNVNKRLGVGLTNPTRSIDTAGIIRVGGTLIYGDTDNQYLRLSNVQGTFLGYNNSNITIVASSVRLLANGVEVLRANQTGNVLINTTTDAGFRLDVNGTARVQGVITSTGGLTSLGGLIQQQTGANSGRMTLLNLRNTGHGNDAALNSALAIAFTNRLAGSVWSDDVIELKVYNNGASTSTTGYNFFTHNNQVTSASSVLAMSINGQSVGIGIETPNTSAKLQIDSTTQGFLPPRMTSAQRDAIASPATGLVVYNTTDNLLSFYNGTAWTNL